MIHLPSIPKTFSELLGASIRYHFATYRKILLLIVFLVVVKDAYIYVGGMPTNVYAYSAVGIVMGLLVTYLLSAMLYAAHCVFNNENIDWRSALNDTRSRMGRVIFGLIIFIVVPVALFSVGEWIANSLTASDPGHYKYAGLIFVLLVGIPVMVGYLYYFFTLPLIIAENFGLREALKHSPALLGHEWRELVRVFGVYACAIAIWVLVSPDTLHGHLMKMYKVSALFDFIAFSVTLPILMNLIILMRNDLKLRKEIREAD